MSASPVKIHAVGLDERGANTLNFFLQKFCADRCEMVSENQAEVFMINMDSVGAEKRLATLEANSPVTPFILMSLHTIETESHYFIRKPLIAKHLLTILNEIEQRPDRQIIQQIQKVEEPSDLEAESSKIERRNKEPVQQPASIVDAAQKLSKADIIHFVGNRPDVNLLDEENKADIYFDPQRYYLGHIQEAIRLAKDKNCSIKLAGLSHTLFISPNLDSVYIELSDAKLRYYGITALYKKGTSIRYRTKFSYQFVEDELMEELCEKQPSYKQNLKSFLWKLSLWTSRGRLPAGVPLDEPVYIQAWPNFTRLIEIPHALRIVACWIPHPKTLLQMAENLPIPQRTIFSFFTATYILGLSGIAERESDILILPAANSAKNDDEKKANRGFLSRFMKKLTTG